MIYDEKTRFESQFSRIYFQTFSKELNSGDRGGSGVVVILAGRSSLSVVCQPALLSRMTPSAPGATCVAISSRCYCMAGVLNRGKTTVAPVPRAGQMAPNMKADLLR